MLVQPPPILVRHSLSEEDIQSYYPNFVERTARQRRPSSGRRSGFSPHTAIIQQGHHFLDQRLWLFRIRSVPCRTALMSAYTVEESAPAQHQQPHSVSSSRTAPYILEPYRDAKRTALSASGIAADSPTYLSGRSRSRLLHCLSAGTQMSRRVSVPAEASMFLCELAEISH
jgi:hypothetical protein